MCTHIYKSKSVHMAAAEQVLVVKILCKIRLAWWLVGSCVLVKNKRHNFGGRLLLALFF